MTELVTDTPPQLRAGVASLAAGAGIAASSDWRVQLGVAIVWAIGGVVDWLTTRRRRRKPPAAMLVAGALTLSACGGAQPAPPVNVLPVVTSLEVEGAATVGMVWLGIPLTVELAGGCEVTTGECERVACITVLSYSYCVTP